MVVTWLFPIRNRNRESGLTDAHVDDGVGLSVLADDVFHGPFDAGEYLAHGVLGGRG